MKKSIQLVALFALTLLGSCTGGNEQKAAEKVEEKPRVKLADVTARPVDQIQEYSQPSGKNPQPAARPAPLPRRAAHRVRTPRRRPARRISC